LAGNAIFAAKCIVSTGYTTALFGLVYQIFFGVTLFFGRRWYIGFIFDGNRILQRRFRGEGNGCAEESYRGECEKNIKKSHRRSS